MAIQLFSVFGQVTFSGIDHPTSPLAVLINNLRASVWGTMGFGGTALVSFIFSRYLIQNEPWKSVAPHVVKAALSSCGTFAAVAVYLFYKIITDEPSTEATKRLINTRVSLIAKSSALVGLIGAAAAALATYYVQESSLAKHSLVPLLGLSAAGSILWIFTHRQNKQLDDWMESIKLT
jgi:hypothetical protein